MSLFHLVLVALIQGITEFLPISSSGHLVFLPALAGFEDQGRAIDVAVHVGTLFAVMLYLRRDTAAVLRGLPGLFRWRIETQDTWLALCLAVATVPVVIAGLVLSVTGLADMLRSITLIGVTTLGFGIVLWWADLRGPVARTAQDWSLRHALVMGLWQVLALVPGTSRSGITITAGRTLGYAREDAARLAMLMSIPTIAASGLLLGAKVAMDGDAALARDAAIAAGLAFLAALAALWAMFRLLRVVSFTPYVIYRVILGVGLIWYGLATAA